MRVVSLSALCTRLFLYHSATAHSGPRLPRYQGFITLWQTTLGRNPLDKLSARSRDLYLTTYKTHRRQTFMPLAGIEPTIPASEWPQTHTLDHAATGIGTRPPLPPQEISLVLISFRDWFDYTKIAWPQGLCQLINPKVASGIEPATIHLPVDVAAGGMYCYHCIL
jgi:hypothetical protein